MNCTITNHGAILYGRAEEKTNKFMITIFSVAGRSDEPNRIMRPVIIQLKQLMLNARAV